MTSSGNPKPNMSFSSRKGVQPSALSFQPGCCGTTLEDAAPQFPERLGPQ
jgi:hypothetical protein